uniref:hypothetical protein n=1 Tax=Litorivivens sp. TaxID=2020868 RepID=UPI0035677B70
MEIMRIRTEVWVPVIDGISPAMVFALLTECQQFIAHHYPRAAEGPITARDFDYQEIGIDQVLHSPFLCMLSTHLSPLPFQ